MLHFSSLLDGEPERFCLEELERDLLGEHDVTDRKFSPGLEHGRHTLPPLAFSWAMFNVRPVWMR